MDQRFVDGRPDVLTYVTEPLDQPITVRGGVTAHLFADTTGSDADWVVKLIDVFPDQDPAEPTMSGYELMISGNILRGRYRANPSDPQPLPANRTIAYTIPMAAGEPHLRAPTPPDGADSEHLVSTLRS